MNRTIAAATMVMTAILLASCDNKKPAEKVQSTSIEDRLALATKEIEDIKVRLYKAEKITPQRYLIPLKKGMAASTQTLVLF